jgi:hypothetical protein
MNLVQNKFPHQRRFEAFGLMLVLDEQGEPAIRQVTVPGKEEQPTLWKGMPENRRDHPRKEPNLKGWKSK